MRLGSVCVGQNHRGFASLFCRSAILVVQPDAWDRYGERATPCFARQNPGRTNSSGLERVVRGPIGVFRGGSGLRRSYLYCLPEFINRAAQLKPVRAKSLSDQRI